MKIRLRWWHATFLPVLVALSLSACSVNTRKTVDPPEQKHGFIYRFFHPEYASGWTWWQKVLFWAGPGHWPACRAVTGSVIETSKFIQKSGQKIAEVTHADAMSRWVTVSRNNPETEKAPMSTTDFGRFMDIPPPNTPAVAAPKNDASPAGTVTRAATHTPRLNTVPRRTANPSKQLSAKK